MTIAIKNDIKCHFPCNTLFKKRRSNVYIIVGSTLSVYDFYVNNCFTDVFLMFFTAIIYVFLLTGNISKLELNSLNSFIFMHLCKCHVPILDLDRCDSILIRYIF